MLYKEYDAETLEHLQKVELEILRDFVDLCDKYNIKYFVCGGTAIGVVRHEGFIPWDDDIDIGFLREDYNKFLEVAENEYGKKYSILNAEKDPKYPLTTSRWILNGTKFQEECFKNINCNFGIFLDLFCFDNVADDPKKMKKQMLSAWFWGKLLILRAIKKPTLYQTGLKSILIYACSYACHYCLKILHISPQWIYKNAMKNARKYENFKTRKVAYMFDPKPFTSLVRKKDIVPLRKMKHSGIDVYAPGNVERYLKFRFGDDYMTLPPEDKRHNHPPYRLDFGRY